MTAILVAELREELALVTDEKSALKSQVLSYQDEVSQYKIRYENLQESYENLQALVSNANRQLYGTKSERYMEDAENPQLGLFENIPPNPNEEQKAQIITVEYQRQKRKRKKDYSNLPRRTIEFKVPKEDRVCSCCGTAKKGIGFKSREKLHHVPAKLEVMVENREVLGCPNGCAGSMSTAESPKQALERVAATEELLAHIAVSKVLDRNPLYHLEKKFETRYKFQLGRNTMARWMIGMGRVFQPLINLMKDEFFDYDIAWTDATKLQVLKEPNRAPTLRSYAYCFMGGGPGREVVLFEYNGAGHKRYLKDWFADYKGTVHGDADPAYADLEKTKEIKMNYCNSHGRRKFEAITKQSKKAKLAKQAMAYYKELYAIEREAKAKEMSPQDRLKLRQEKSQPVMDAFKIWLDTHADLVFPKTPIGKAIGYCRNHWPGMIRFLEDGRLEIDNNLCEQKIKVFVMARKNFLFSDTTQGADALGNHFSLMLTAQKHGLNPLEYYTHILKRLPYCKTFKDYEKLLPWNVQFDVSQ